MIVRRFAYIVVSGALLGAPTTAAAAECGLADPATHAKARGTLTLDPDSVTAKAFKDRTEPETLLLRFKVTGCDLPADPELPEPEMLPKQGATEIPAGAVKLVRAVPDRAEYSLRLTADPGRFDPGSYGGVYEIRAPQIVTTRTPIELSRSEDSEFVPIGIGVLGGLAGLLWFLLLSLARGAKTTIKRWHYGVVFVAAAVAGALAAYGAYRSQDVWSLGANWTSALGAAFTGATTGTMAMALAVLWPEPETEAE